MKIILTVYALAVVMVGGVHVQAVPIESGGGEGVVSADRAYAENVTNSAVEPTTAAAGHEETKDLETAATEEKENTYDNTVGGMMVPDNIASGSHYDPSVYSGLLAPGAFQQYVNQFGAGYGPYSGAYPAPIGYAAPAYAPNPYVVQTGYEGYLVPSVTTAAPSTSSSSLDLSSIFSLLNPLTLLSTLTSTLMLSTVFRVIAAVVTAIAMVFFGGAVTTAICNLTPLCNISFKAVSYLKRSGTAEDVGRMIVDEMTPERVRRAAEFVRNAIRKYHDMQKMVDSGEKLE